MAHNPKIRSTYANTALDTLLAHANSGFIDVISGTQAASATTALGGGNTVLCVFPLSATAFGSASAGISTANSITTDSDADATGTATWFRMYGSDHSTAVLDGSVGTSGCDLNLNTVSIVQHAIVSVSSLTVSLPV